MCIQRQKLRTMKYSFTVHVLGKTGCIADLSRQPTGTPSQEDIELADNLEITDGRHLLATELRLEELKHKRHMIL